MVVHDTSFSASITAPHSTFIGKTAQRLYRLWGRKIDFTYLYTRISCQTLSWWLMWDYLWGVVARHDRSGLFIIPCGQSHLFMNMLWSAMISCELSYHVAAVLPVSCGGNFPHKSLVLNLSSKGHGYHTCIWDKVILGRRLKGYTSNWRFGWY